MTILTKAMKITLLPFKVKGLSKSMFLNFERSEKNILCKEYFTKHFAKLWSVGYRLRSRKKDFLSSSKQNSEYVTATPSGFHLKSNNN